MESVQAVHRLGTSLPALVATDSSSHIVTSALGIDNYAKMVYIGVWSSRQLTLWENTAMHIEDRLYVVTELKTNRIISIHSSEETARAKIAKMMRAATTTVSYYLEYWELSE